MTKSKAGKPSNLELQILSILWDRGPLPVKKINAAMPDKKQRAYTTVLTLLQLMEKKGLVTHEREGVRHIFKAKPRRNTILKPMMQDLVSNIFGGNPASAMQFIMDREQVTDDDVATMRKLLDDWEQKK
ncbi:MAG: BlaI/MecI/CopY family transcriptional regulator [Candidatus Hydrogenedentes bacterium]|nr:BlaI/MecI/CopY family transcriptional regulator [Candidatus Hydrogenedentota bacterium]